MCCGLSGWVLMVITAFTTRAAEDLDKLARDIATAARDANASPAAIQALHQRYRDLQNAAAEHARLLSTSLDDTTAALNLVNAQLVGLLASAG